jgi:hypothetical protein
LASDAGGTLLVDSLSRNKLRGKLRRGQPACPLALLALYLVTLGLGAVEARWPRRVGGSPLPHCRSGGR